MEKGVWKMKIELSFKDDAELRKYIKDMIKGQVKNLVREEITQIIKDVHKGKLGKESMEHAIKEEIKNVIGYYAKSHTHDWNLRADVRKSIDERINKYFEENNVAGQIEKRLKSAVIKLDVDIAHTGVGKPFSIKI